MNIVKQILLFVFVTTCGIDYAKSQVGETLDSYSGNCGSRELVKSATQHICLFVVDSRIKNSYLLDLKDIGNGLFVKNGIAAYLKDCVKQLNIFIQKILK